MASQILVRRVAQQVELRLIRLQDGTAGRQPFQADGGLVEKTRKIALAAAQQRLCLFMCRAGGHGRERKGNIVAYLGQQGQFGFIKKIGARRIDLN